MWIAEFGQNWNNENIVLPAAQNTGSKLMVQLPLTFVENTKGTWFIKFHIVRMDFSDGYIMLSWHNGIRRQVLLGRGCAFPV